MSGLNKTTLVVSAHAADFVWRAGGCPGSSRRRNHRRSGRRGCRAPRTRRRGRPKLAQQRQAKEERTRERLRARELGLDIYGLRAKLEELGVEYFDSKSGSK